MKNPFTALFRARDKPRDSISTASNYHFTASGSGKQSIKPRKSGIKATGSPCARAAMIRKQAKGFDSGVHFISDR